MKANNIKKVLVIILVAISLFLILTYSLGLIVFNNTMQLVDNKGASIAKGYEILDLIGFDYASFESKYKKEEFTIKSSLDGHSIPVSYFVSSENNKENKTIIMVHGLKGNRVSIYPIAKMFLDNGYNVVSYDQRSSGENYAKYTTYGYLECKDTIDVLNYLDNELNKETPIFLWGASFGGGTVGQSTKAKLVKERVSAIILDCPVSEIDYFIEKVIDRLGLLFPKKYLIFSGNLVTKLKLGFSYKDCKVGKIVGESGLPVLILNTKADTTTPYFMGIDIFNSIKTDKKEIYTSSDSPHSRIFYTYKEEYTKKTLDFLNKYEKVQ